MAIPAHSPKFFTILMQAPSSSTNQPKCQRRASSFSSSSISSIISIVLEAYPANLNLFDVTCSINSISLYLGCDLLPTKKSWTELPTYIALLPGSFLAPVGFIDLLTSLTPFQFLDSAHMFGDMLNHSSTPPPLAFS